MYCQVILSGKSMSYTQTVKCLQHQMNWGRGLEERGIALTQGIFPAQKQKPRKTTNIFSIKSDTCTEMPIETPPQYEVTWRCSWLKHCATS